MLATLRRVSTVSILLACLGACDKPPSTPPSTPPSDAPAGADRNFGCNLDGVDLQPWTAEGLELPDAVKASFEAWTTMDGDVVPPELEAACQNPPSGGEYSPVKAADQGGVSRGDIVVATRDVTVYRAYTAANFECGVDSPAGEFGSWWSPIEPTLPKQAYRDANAICPAWNDLTMIVSCTLAEGTVVLIGPTQSATCAGSSTCDPAPEGWDTNVPATTTPQLFINTYTADGRRPTEDLQTFLLDCESRAWEG